MGYREPGATYLYSECVCVSVCVLCLYSLWTQCKYFASIFLFPARKYDSGEYLNITGITRDQAGDYECSALNDIASPDTKTVKVTVNCKYISFFFPASLFFSMLVLQTHERQEGRLQ